MFFPGYCNIGLPCPPHISPSIYPLLIYILYLLKLFFCLKAFSSFPPGSLTGYTYLHMYIIFTILQYSFLALAPCLPHALFSNYAKPVSWKCVSQASNLHFVQNGKYSCYICYMYVYMLCLLLMLCSWFLFILEDTCQKLPPL